MCQTLVLVNVHVVSCNCCACTKLFGSFFAVYLRKLLDLKCCLVSGEFKGVLSGNAPPPKPARLLAKIGHCGHRKTCEMTGNQ